MATLTSHTLNGTDGTHAGGIKVTLTNLNSRETIFESYMDDGGRLSQEISEDKIDTQATYELVFDVKAYWATQEIHATVTQIALRFEMLDPSGLYHMPVIFSPNSYSMWTSA
jgi:5-hydroxyisourate hydrolase